MELNGEVNAKSPSSALRSQSTSPTRPARYRASSPLKGLAQHPVELHAQTTVPHTTLTSVLQSETLPGHEAPYSSSSRDHQGPNIDPVKRHRASSSIPSFSPVSSINNLVQTVTSGRSPGMGYTGDNRPKRASLGGNGLLGGLFTKTGQQVPSNSGTSAGTSSGDLGSLGFGGIAGSEVVLSPTFGNSESTMGQKLRNFTGLNSSASSMKDGVMSSGASITTFQSSFITVTSRPTTPTRNSISSSIFTSPNPRPSTPLKSILTPPHPDLVNEFQGLDFNTIISSFLTQPHPKLGSQHPYHPNSSTLSEPSEALKLTPQARLEDLADTAKDLLERIYDAYIKRTEALTDSLAEQGIMREELEDAKVKIRYLNMQMEKMVDEQKREKDERDEVMLELVTEKVKIEEERLRREEEKATWEMEERTRIRQEILLELTTGDMVIVEPVDLDRTPRKKRVSSGGSSDSGFDSDSESLVSTTGGLNRVPEVSAASGGSSLQPPPTRNGKIDLAAGRGNYTIRMATGLKCENCAKAINNGPSAIQTSPTSTSTVQINPLRYPTPLSPLRGPPSSSSTILTKDSGQTAAASRWTGAFAALRGGNTNNGSGSGGPELDRLRGENKILRERVGNLECTVSEVLGIVGGWRDV